MQLRILLSRQRSGSHFLKSLIDSRFPGVVCTGEVLEKPAEGQSPVLAAQPEIPRFWTWYANGAANGSIVATPDERIPAFDYYLSEIAWKSQPSELVIDVKYNCVRSLSGYEDTDNGSLDFATYVREKGVPILHLIRKNILSTVVSHALARQTGIWHRAAEKELGEVLPKLRLDATEVLRLIEQTNRLVGDYQEIFREHVCYAEVVYEDLVREVQTARDGAGMETLTRFFERQRQDAGASSIWCKKTTPEDLSEVVENWDEIVRALSGTPFAWMTEPALLAAA
jgi:LPS sulfotransferase NodH